MSTCSVASNMPERSGMLEDYGPGATPFQHAQPLIPLLAEKSSGTRVFSSPGSKHNPSRRTERALLQSLVKRNWVTLIWTPHEFLAFNCSPKPAAKKHSGALSRAA